MKSGLHPPVYVGTALAHSSFGVPTLAGVRVSSGHSSAAGAVLAALAQHFTTSPASAISVRVAVQQAVEQGGLDYAILVLDTTVAKSPATVHGWHWLEERVRHCWAGQPATGPALALLQSLAVSHLLTRAEAGPGQWLTPDPAGLANWLTLAAARHLSRYPGPGLEQTWLTTTRPGSIALCPWPVQGGPPPPAVELQLAAPAPEQAWLVRLANFLAAEAAVGQLGRLQAWGAERASSLSEGQASPPAPADWMGFDFAAYVRDGGFTDATTAERALRPFDGPAGVRRLELLAGTARISSFHPDPQAGLNAVECAAVQQLLLRHPDLARACAPYSATNAKALMGTDLPYLIIRPRRAGQGGAALAGGAVAEPELAGGRVVEGTPYRALGIVTEHLLGDAVMLEVPPPRPPIWPAHLTLQDLYNALRLNLESDIHWEALYKRMFKRLRYRGLEWGGPGTDMAQETMIGIYKKLQKPATGKTDVEKLANTIMKRRMIDYLRRHVVRKKLTELIRDALITATTAPLADGENRRKLEAVEAAIASVRGQVLASTNPSKYRCFEKCALEGRKGEEVARELDVSVQVVYNNVNRVTEKIREAAVRLARETAHDPSAVNDWPGSYYIEHRTGTEDFQPDYSDEQSAYEIQ